MIKDFGKFGSQVERSDFRLLISTNMIMNADDLSLVIWSELDECFGIVISGQVRAVCFHITRLMNKETHKNMRIVTVARQLEGGALDEDF